MTIPEQEDIRRAIIDYGQACLDHDKLINDGLTGEITSKAVLAVARRSKKFFGCAETVNGFIGTEAAIAYLEKIASEPNEPHWYAMNFQQCCMDVAQQARDAGEPCHQ